MSNIKALEGLREYASSLCGGLGGDALEHYADLIEREVAEQYIELPVDADGEVIHIGDKVTLYGRLHVYEVDAIHFYNDHVSVGYKGESGCGCESPNHFHHHKPTVEDVLRDFAYCLEDGATDQTLDELIGEYVAKFQLANSEAGDAE